MPAAVAACRTMGPSRKAALDEVEPLGAPPWAAEPDRPFGDPDPPGDEPTTNVRPATAATIAASTAAKSSRLCRIRRFASAISGSNEIGSLGARASTDASMASTSGSRQGRSRSGVIPEHWPSRGSLRQSRIIRAIQRDLAVVVTVRHVDVPARLGCCQQVAERGDPSQRSARSASTSSAPGSQVPAATFARTCSDFVAPAITQLTAGIASRPPIAASSSEIPRSSA
jgi:hypothetical protein